MPDQTSTPSPYAYQQLAQWLHQQIDSGQLSPGSRLPSIRSLCRDRQLSKSTVLSAYDRLEAEGVIEARSRSGFFVRQSGLKNTLKAPALSQPSLTPKPVSADQVLLDIMQQGAAFDLLSHQSDNRGSENRSSENNYLENKGNEELRRCLARSQRRQDSKQQLYYDRPEGNLELRQQLAKRLGQAGSQVHADNLLITSGCQHALMLALMASTQPGDLVAIESPGFYGALQLLEVLGLKALELASDANTGVNPEALALALEHWDIKALILTPSFATPTGSTMPDAHKRRILELTVPRQIALIEDDIYGELPFALQRPRSLHSMEQELFGIEPDNSHVILCSSFSKCLSRDLRLGWIVPGRFRAQVQRLKLVSALATSQTQQQGLSEFLSGGGLDRHLRSLRQQLQQQCARLQQLIAQYLPMAISASQPQGGLCLWLELPEHIDTIELYTKARAQGVIITPGPLFSGQNKYRNFIRLSFAHSWCDGRITALQTLAAIINSVDKSSKI